MRRVIPWFFLTASILFAQQPRCQGRAQAQTTEMPIAVKSSGVAKFSTKVHNSDFVRPEASVGQTIYVDDDWIFSAQPIPTADSDLVVTGTVMDARARLSEDGRAVITEYAIKPQKLIKGRQSDTEKPLTVFRLGGRVRYSSGATVLYKFSDREFPRLGKRYLFFLRASEGGSYELLTAYLLVGGCSKPLDASRQEKFKRFDGRSESELLAVAASGEAKK